MDENDFIFCVLHNPHGECKIRDFFYGMSGNDSQTLNQHLILVCTNLQRFFLCTGSAEVSIFNPLVQNQKFITFPDKSLYTIRTLAAKQE